jgi:uncharacterized protein YeaO (DUF488 family)
VKAESRKQKAESRKKGQAGQAVMPKQASRLRSGARLGVKRVYAPAEAQDGTRILVDRLWPRGIAKDKAKIDIWLKDIAPSDALRRRVHAKDVSWDEFVLEYGRELAREPGASAAQELIARMAREPVTLLYAARDEQNNNAIALKLWLTNTAGRAQGAGPPGSVRPPAKKAARRRGGKD